MNYQTTASRIISYYLLFQVLLKRLPEIRKIDDILEHDSSKFFKKVF